MILALYDVSGIQDYIFQSNRMRENIGASAIVGRVLQGLLPDVLKGLGKDKIKLEWETQEEFTFLNDSTVSIEIIYNGGGNALVAFRYIDDFHQVNEELSLKLLHTSYSLHLAIAAIESDGQNFVADKRRLDRRLTEVKARMLRPRPAGAFPFSEQEARSGLPITDYDSHTRQNVSALQKRKLAQGHEKAKEVIQFPGTGQFTEWALEMEHLVRARGEDSYVAVVHIDGNSMGAQIRSMLDTWEKESYSYSRAVSAMRKLSLGITNQFRTEFENTIKDLMNRIPSDHWLNGRKQLPVRPLIMDGDDVTFVCAAEWGLPLTAELLRRLEQGGVDNDCHAKQDVVSMSACAGVAFVHSHFPFNIAYEVSEACCRSAKQAKWKTGEEKGSYIDFKVVRGSYPEEEPGEQKRKPYRIGSGNAEGREFGLLETYMNKLSITNWPRWRLEKLYTTIKGNSELLSLYVKECQSRGYELRSLGPENVGAIEDSPLLDALELIGMFDGNLFNGREGDTHEDGMAGD